MTTADINHPRQLLLTWREEARRLKFHAGDHPGNPQAGDVLLSRAYCLEQCASELENRLRWSGILEP